ncbi:uncharacterized protein F4817DRAFT_335703 [Daldinia loculata]|uniref:uncharacterized protein n=1 Tax=Daldinia loculata TaxID=103429 RepID=UPI0020C1E3C7|nr:uncharacterized protein F4817DRAFT_335703 [Daldinia loculata]KAI1648051.1 hypothetical protein F4817DRAFT_335703 [Daldinia loculata]
MTIRSDTIEDGLLDPSHRLDPSQQAHTLIHRIYNSIKPRRVPQPKSYPPLSSIPRTSPERLALASPDSPDDASSAPTVLYLAYGSNLSAETFLGMRHIRPLSMINVSVPTFDLAFDLPALAYWEPCFANVSPRKIPMPPIPGDPPRPPFPPPSNAISNRQDELVEEEERLPGTLLPSLPPDHSPSWSKGLYGVVYEVTREDYTRIIHTEGTAYEEILTPCLALPPPFHVPEKPPIPELPRPFLARTLYAPQLPSFDPPDGDDGGDGGDDKKRWWQKLLLPVQRTPGYAQPSPRYLRMIRDGAREHYLPDDYQTYLARLEAYTITTWRQDIGRWLFLFTVVPSFALLALLGYLLADKDSGIPKWLEAATTIQRNLMWKVYDYVFKPLFGDGERTIQEEDDSGSTSRIRTQAWGSEKNALLGDW